MRSFRHGILTSLALAGLTAGMVACSSDGGSAGTNADQSTSTTTATTEPAEANEPMLAATPPMGWNSWNQVRCDGLNEDVVKAAADALVSNGLDDLGYQYVVVDDCWQAPERDADGALATDPERFPSGLAALADYVHDKGLKFGLYLAPGSETCAMHWDDYPATGIGSFGHERKDAEMLEQVGVDYLKYDWCRADETDGLDYEPAFTLMRDELARLDRPIVYSISDYGKSEPWTWAPEVANLWRTTSDIAPIWPIVALIVDHQADLYPYSGPGHWNDPDMLQVGNGAMTPDETRAHVGMWAMLAAPLMIGTDLDALAPDVLEALSNPEIIAIDQDPLGQQARRLETGDQEVWVRELDGGDLAVAFLNETAEPAEIATTLGDLDAPVGTWTVRDASALADLPPTDGPINATVPAHGAVILRLSPA